MITSKQATFSDSQAITASARSTNVIDLGAMGTPAGATSPLLRKLGANDHLPLLIQVVEDFATLTSLVATFRQSDNEDLSSPDDLVSSYAVPVADLTAGFIFPMLVLPYPITKRYIGIYYTVAGTNATAGKIFSGITDAQTNG